MAEMVEAVRITDKEGLPEEFTGVTTLGKNERGKLAAEYDDGRRKEVGESAASLLLKTLVSMDKAEEMVVTEDPLERIKELERQLETERLEHRSELEARDKKIDELSTKVENLTQSVQDLTEILRRHDLITDPESKTIKADVETDVTEKEVRSEDKVSEADIDGVRKTKVIEEDDGVEKIETVEEPVSIEEPTRKRFEVRETYGRRFRNRTPWAVPEREYYVGEGGRPYYVDEGGDEVYVTEEEVRGRRLGGVALVAAGVAGAIIWELIGEKIFGWDGSSHHLKEVVNNQSTIIHNQGVQLHDLKEVNDHLTYVDKELLHAHDHDRRMIQGLHNQIHRAAKHQDRIINDLRGDLARDHIQETNSIGKLHDKLQNTGIYWGARYPWDWAANKVGSLGAEGWLHTLAGRAAKHGHKVVWLHNHGKEILQVDGTTNTAKVVSTLNQYR